MATWRGKGARKGEKPDCDYGNEAEDDFERGEQAEDEKARQKGSLT